MARAAPSVGCDTAKGCFVVALVGVGCTDGDACTKGDACAVDGACKGSPMGCDDGQGCTQDSCDKEL